MLFRYVATSCNTVLSFLKSKERDPKVAAMARVLERHISENQVYKLSSASEIRDSLIAAVT